MNGRGPEERRTEVDVEGPPLLGAGVEVAPLHVKVPGADRLGAQPVEQRHLGPRRYTHWGERGTINQHTHTHKHTNGSHTPERLSSTHTDAIHTLRRYTLKTDGRSSRHTGAIHTHTRGTDSCTH